MSNRTIQLMLRALPAASLAALTVSCVHVHVDPINVNVTIRRVDDELDRFYAFQDHAATTTQSSQDHNANAAAPATTQPAGVVQ